MKTIRDLIGQHDFFKKMDPDTLDLIAGCGQNVHFQPNDYIAREGDEANTFFVLRSGRVAIQMHHTTRGIVTIETISQNEIVGFSWIFPPYTYMFDVKVMEHASAIAIDGKCIREKCESNPAMGYSLMKAFAGLMTRRLYNTRIQLIDVYSH